MARNTSANFRKLATTDQHGVVKSVALKSPALAAFWCFTALSCESGSDDAPRLPGVVASSKYIDYATTGDTSVICMGDALAHKDRFIEQIAAYLGVAVPDERIVFVRDPEGEFGKSTMLACDKASFCYYYDEARPGGVILSASAIQYHELVHAVDIPQLGAGHRVLVEGLAEYLGSSNAADAVLPGFAETFKAMVERAPQPDDYRVAMQFVGSILVRDGVTKYHLLRARLSPDAGLEEFGVTYTEIYGRPLEADLVAMSVAPIRSIFVPPGCAEGEGDELAWNAPGLLETTIRGECGDPLFFAAGTGGPHPGFYKTFVINIETAGFYFLEVSGIDGAEGPQGSISACPAADGSIRESSIILYPGRHRLSVGFPLGQEPSGEARVKLAYAGPPPGE